MKVDQKVAIEHGLKKEEFDKICELLKRVPNIVELGIFSDCTMPAFSNNVRCLVIACCETPICSAN